MVPVRRVFGTCRYGGVMKTACIKIVAPREVVLDEICLDAASLGDSEVLIRSRYSLTNPGTELAAFTGLEAEYSSDFRYGSVLEWR